MQTFVCFLNWTDEAAKKAGEAAKRHDMARQQAEKLGGRLVSAYVTTGQYDVVATLEMPNADAMAKFVMRISEVGSARTTTSLAWPVQEFSRLISG